MQHAAELDQVGLRAFLLEAPGIGPAFVAQGVVAGEHDQGGEEDGLAAHEGEGRAAVLKTACDAVWCLLVQREVMGLRDRAAVVAQYGIPREVMNRLGAR